MELVPLHKCPKYLDECASVLNEEWPRSTTARLHSLEISCDSLPSSLILLERTGIDDTRPLIGHSRLSRVHGRESSCLVESVVVRKDIRGKGYGRTIMLETEEYARSRGFRTMYLTTHDKQKFYEQLGYEYCQPVICVGGHFVNLPDSFKKALAGVSQQPGKTRVQGQDTGRVETDNVMKEGRTYNCAPPVAPPLPSLPPPPPCMPVPPPPHLPPLVLNSKDTQGIGTRNIERWDPARVSWMKKEL